MFWLLFIYLAACNAAAVQNETWWLLQTNLLLWDPHTHILLKRDPGFLTKHKHTLVYLISTGGKAGAPATHTLNTLTTEPSNDSMRSDIMDLL